MKEDSFSHLITARTIPTVESDVEAIYDGRLSVIKNTQELDLVGTIFRSTDLRITISSEDAQHQQFNSALLANRMLDLLSTFNVGVGFRPKIENMLVGELGTAVVAGESSEHRMATLAVMFGEEILSATGAIDLNLLLPVEQRALPAEEKTPLLLVKITKKISEINSDLPSFSEEFIPLGRKPHCLSRLGMKPCPERIFR